MFTNLCICLYIYIYIAYRPPVDAGTGGARASQALHPPPSPRRVECLSP